MSANRRSTQPTRLSPISHATALPILVSHLLHPAAPRCIRTLISPAQSPCILQHLCAPFITLIQHTAPGSTLMHWLAPVRTLQHAAPQWIAQYPPAPYSTLTHHASCRIAILPDAPRSSDSTIVYPHITPLSLTKSHSTRTHLTLGTPLHVIASHLFLSIFILFPYSCFLQLTPSVPLQLCL